MEDFDMTERRCRIFPLVAFLALLISAPQVWAEEVPNPPREETKNPPDKDAQTTPVGASEAPRVQKSQRVITLPPIIVNIQDAKARYLKAAIALEMSSSAVVEEIDKTEILDFLTERLGRIKVDEIDNTAGRIKLKQELMDGLNKLLKSGTVEKLYFSEFIVQ
jgi:flagellar FliL protein